MRFDAYSEWRYILSEDEVKTAILDYINKTQLGKPLTLDEWHVDIRSSQYGDTSVSRRWPIQGKP